MEKLDKSRETALVNGVISAIKLANAGTAPSEAVAKIASDGNFNKAETARMVEAFNVSKTRSHLKSAAGDSRADNFPLADIERVYGIMYPNNVEAPAKVAEANWQPKQTSLKEARFFVNKEHTPLERNAKAADFGGREIESYTARAHDTFLKLAQYAELAKREVAVTREKLATLIRAYAEAFKPLYAPSVTFVEKAAVAKWGDSVAPIFSMVRDLLGKSCSEKQASSDFSGLSVSDTAAISDILRTAELLQTQVKQAETITSAYNEFSTRYKSLASELTKDAFIGPLLTSVAGSSVARQIGDYNDTLKGLSGMAGSAEDYIGEIAGPDVEAELKGVRAKTILKDLMENDEVIKQYAARDPYSVVSRYNDIAAIIPLSVDKPAIVRSALRKALESDSLDPNEISNLVTMELNLHKMTPTSVSAMTAPLTPLSATAR